MTTTNNKIISPRDYYCSKKFTFLKIDIEKKTTYNCHAAQPHPIDFNWLENNPSQLFNNPTSVTEREMMLRNERNSSCEQNCWPAEDFGGQSPRLSQQGYIKIDPVVVRLPTEVDLTIGRDCNLSCSYCSKEYSTSWANDIINNGEYIITQADDRYKVDDLDLVLSKVSQNKKYNSVNTKLIYREIDKWIDQVEWLMITGGEPFLNNQLFDIISKGSNAKLIDIYTGLGLSYSRFDALTSNLTKFKNLRVILSCENVDKFLEFNRYGIKWLDYQKKLDLLKTKGINYIFNSTLSNVSLFGFAEFMKWADRHNDSQISFCYVPKFLSPYVLDDESKDSIVNSLSTISLPNGHLDQIKKSMNKEPSKLQIQNCREFLIEFTNRRKDLNLNIFPKSFLKWLGIK